MAAPVDVLAAMRNAQAYVDDAAQFPEQFKKGVVARHQREITFSIDAVFHLIEAASDLLKSGSDEKRNCLRAALARCKGAN